MATSDLTPRNGFWTHRIALGIFVLPALVLAVAAANVAWTTDDGFIALRVAANLIRGHGFVYNVGERVEAATSPAWVLILAGFGYVLQKLVSLEWIAASLGIAFSSGALLLCGYMHRRRHERSSDATFGAAGAPMIPVGAYVLAFLPATWECATGGLEGGLSLLWIASALVAATLLPGKVLGSVLIGCGPLIRPDFAIFSTAWALSLGFSRRAQKSNGSIWRLILPLAAPSLAFQVLRMGYFASLVPNTALAKEAFEPNWHGGVEYVWSFIATYHLYIPLALIVALQAADRWAKGGRSQPRPATSMKPPTALQLSVLGGLTHAVWVVSLGGDFMHGRLLIPATAAICFPLSLPYRRRSASYALGMIGLAAWSLCAAAFLRPPLFGAGTWERRFWSNVAGTDNPVTVDDWRKAHVARDGTYLRALSERPNRLLLSSATLLRQPHEVTRNWVGKTLSHDKASPDELAELEVLPSTHPHAAIVAYRFSAGVGPYLAGDRVYIADGYSLADPIGARLDLEGVRGRPAHEKVLPPAWARARFSSSEASEGADVKAAREALACEPLAELLEAISQPLTISRFVQNFAASPRLTRLRIPRDIGAARAQLCRQPLQPILESKLPKRPVQSVAVEMDELVTLVQRQ